MSPARKLAKRRAADRRRRARRLAAVRACAACLVRLATLLDAALVLVPSWAAVLVELRRGSPRFAGDRCVIWRWRLADA